MAVLLSDALMQAADSPRAFYGLTQIKDVIRSSKNYKRDGSRPEEAGALLLLSTAKQQTWLVATKSRLYCILDDPKKGEPRVNWSIDKRELVDDQGVKIEVRARPNTERTGKIDIGPKHTEWLYSRSLFVSRSVEEEVKALIQEKMVAEPMVRRVGG